jgi:choline-glycine betaine transporter
VKTGQSQYSIETFCALLFAACVLISLLLLTG